MDPLPEKYRYISSRFQIIHRRFIVLRVISSSKLTKVYEIQDKINKHHFALKITECYKTSDWFNEPWLFNILDRLLNANGQNIYLDSWIEEHCLCILMRLLEGTVDSLYDMLCHGDQLQVFLQTAEQLGKMHENGFVHLDVKPKNILYWRKDSKTIKVYLIDFGISRNINSDLMGVKEGDRLTSAKELVDCSNPSELDLKKCDVFSLAVCYVDMLTKGSMPQNGKEYQQSRNTSNFYESFPEFRALPLQLKKIIKSMLSPDPKVRPHISRVIRNLKEFRKNQRRRSESFSRHTISKIQTFYNTL